MAKNKSAAKGGKVVVTSRAEKVTVKVAAALPSKSRLSPAAELDAKPGAVADAGGNGAAKPINQTPELGPISEGDLRKVKTGLTRRDLDHYRDLLHRKRAEILGDVASLETDSRNNSSGNLSNMPLHMADVGSDNYEQEFTLGLVESERLLLHEIEEALLRMTRGIFGVCLEMGKPIGKARLDAKPWAKYCIDVAREMERRGKTG